MLCIIFTSTKMLVGTIHTSKPTLLPLLPGNRHAVSHENNYLLTLQTYFERVMYGYAQAQLNAEEKPHVQTLLPRITIVVTRDALNHNQQQITSLTDWIISQTSRCTYGGVMEFYDTFFLGYGLPKEANRSVLLCDGLNAPTSIYRYAEGLKTPELLEYLPEFSFQNGLEKLYISLQKQFELNGVTLDENLKTQLWTQLEVYDKSQNEFIFKKNQKDFELNFKYFLSSNKYFNTLCHNRGLLRNTLNNNELSRFNVQKIFFCGDLYDNEIFRDFCINVLGIEKKTIRIFSNIKIFTYICTGINKTALSEQQTLADKYLLSRKSLVERIRNECTEKQKYRKYAQKYVSLGLTIGLSETYIVGMIRSCLFGAQSLTQLGHIVATKSIFDTPASHELIESFTATPSVVYSTSAALLAPQMGVVPVQHENAFAQNNVVLEQIEDKLDTSIEVFTENTNSLEHFAKNCKLELNDLLRSNLGWFFRVEQYYALHSCLSFKGKTKENNETRMFYFLPLEASRAQIVCFEILRDRNLLYYGKVVSDIEASAIGSYYSRPYFDGVGLGTYIKNIELDKKIFFNELTSNELELLLEVWKEINRLPFATKISDANQLLINTKWKLPFNKKISVTLTHLDVQDIETNEMYDDVHQIFQQLLSKSLYEFFKANFNH